MPIFRMRPVIKEAVQWNGINTPEMAAFIGNPKLDSSFYYMKPIPIETLEGTMVALVGDWVVKGIDGEFSPCKPHIFKRTYEEITKIPWYCDRCGFSGESENPALDHEEKSKSFCTALMISRGYKASLV